MKRLERPPLPDWYPEFREKGEQQLRNMMSTVERRGVQASFLNTLSLFTNTATRRKIYNAFLDQTGAFCSVCESPLFSVAADHLDHYRPNQFAGSNRKDRSHPRHYWWLIYEWENFQLLCPLCNRYKRSLFPVAARRAQEGATGDSLASEKPLILNPFDDIPEEHLTIARNGLFVPLSRRGNVTIEVYQLNRKELADRRAGSWRILNDANDFEDRGPIRVETEAEKSEIITRAEQGPLRISGATRIILNQMIEVRNSTPTPPPLTGNVASLRFETPLITPEAFETRWVSRVRMEDFGLFSDIEIALPEPVSDREPWLGIVGENGVGKSSFLKAITLALTDEDTARNLVPDAREIFNRNTRRRKGLVEVELSDGTIRRLVFGRNTITFTFEGPEIRMPVIALGASRITGRKRSAHSLPEAGAVDNLFDPVLPLVDAEEWLCDTDFVSSRDFATFADNLKYLIGLPVGTEVSRRKGKIRFRRGDSRQSLGQMSDGFRSVIGLTAHIMKHLAPDTPIMSEAEGTVLLDEIELHLHPRWKIQIVSKLRELFPRVRFIVTTHDPLCLRGFERNESYLFRLNAEGDNVETLPLDIRPGLDVDDILTGGWFGLGTTYDADTDEMINTLSALSLKEDTLRVRGEEMPAADRDRMDETRRTLRARLPGFSGSDAEVETLADVARGKVGIGEIESIDTNALQARLRAAFNKDEAEE